MGRFNHLATQPARGVADMIRWRIVEPIKGNAAPKDSTSGPVTRPHDKDIVASADASLVWIGHASFLLTLGGRRILTDPVLGRRVGLIERLSAPGIPIGELPPIDIVLVTHNHRDHLDPWSIRRIGDHPTYVVPAGNGGLIRSIVRSAKVVELDWWETTGIGSVEVMLVPARHWSMHWPWDRNEGLWGGYVIRGPEGTAYHSGDTAFWDTFEEIGRRAGGIDWAMLPIGAYEPRWFMEPQHMDPDEAAAAARLLGAKNFVAMHWGTFKLTDEPIAEPPSRARSAWAREGGKEESLWILDPGETRHLR
ncbi:MAG: MBL fold metallo-hydrolase [Polyangiaceae bacterium]|nr:MBL fold metallo-hydrolase [Polyangiaceae bacterium]